MRSAPNTPPNACRREPAGSALLELVVAAAVLTVGVLGAAGVLTTAARDHRRARTRHAATALLAERYERWRTTPCTPESGERPVGPLRERWRVTRSGTLATLADTIDLDPGGLTYAGLVGATWCAP